MLESGCTSPVLSLTSPLTGDGGRCTQTVEPSDMTKAVMRKRSRICRYRYRSATTTATQLIHSSKKSPDAASTARHPEVVSVSSRSDFKEKPGRAVQLEARPGPAVASHKCLRHYFTKHARDLPSTDRRGPGQGSDASFLRHYILNAWKILAHPPSSSDQRQFERRTSELQQRCEIKAIATPY